MSQQTCKKLSFSFHLGDVSDVRLVVYNDTVHAMAECAGRKVF